MGFENVGRVWTPGSLDSYLAGIAQPAWCQAITLHHTASPSLAMRPNGLTIKHIENIRDYYKNDKGWSAGPHLFIDEDQVFGMCDLRKKGVHAVSFNKSALGIEVLGDYDEEDPRSGRGLACWQTAAATTAVLLKWLGLPANNQTVLFHRDDPKTQKSCPGKRVDKAWVLRMIANPAVPAVVASPKPEVGIAWNKWDFRGERWCVPIHDFLVAKGMTSASVIAMLKARGGKIYYRDELIEGAYYVDANAPLRPNDCTWVPVRELVELFGRD